MNKTNLKHVAFIMDGTRRWARGKGLPVMVGHRRGFDRIKGVVKHANKLGIKHVTFWAFSTENWNREEKEVSGLMSIFRSLFKKSALKEILAENARITVFGDMSRFDEDIQKNVREVISETENNTGIRVNVALNYGGRAELLRVTNLLLKEGAESADEDKFAGLLYSAGQPDPDLIVRTGGEQRLSGYLPWQSVYSELYFTDTFWPDFDAKALDVAIEDYHSRSRRFGK